MQAIIQEAIIEEVKKRPLLYGDIISEGTEDAHQFLWEEVFNAVVPNWNLLNWTNKFLIGGKIKNQWLLLKEKVSYEPEQKAERDTILKAGDSEDIQEHSEDMERKRLSQRSNNHLGESAGNLRDQSLDPEEDLIETFNRVLKTSSKPVDSRRTKSYQFNRKRNISSATQSNSKPCIIKDQIQLMNQPKSSHNRSNDEVDSRSTISEHFNHNRNTSPATHNHNSHFQSLNTETKVTHSYSASRTSISSYSASQNNHSPIQSLGATPPPFIASFPSRHPKRFQKRRPKTFWNPSSRRKLNYPPSDELKHSLYFPPNPPIHFPLPNQSSTTHTLDSSQFQIISDNSLNPSTFLANPPDSTNLHQWNALPESSNLPYCPYPPYAFPAVDQCNQFYPTNEIGYFPSPNPCNYYPFSNPFSNPYHQNFQIPYWHHLSVKIPVFNDDGSITFTSDTGDQGYFHNS